MKLEVIDRKGGRHLAEGSEGESLVWVLRNLHLVEATCGGCASCATCQIYVDARWRDRLPRMGADEQTLLDELINRRVDSRLACQITLCAALDGLCITVAPEA